VRGTIEGIEKKLDAEQFLRVNRSSLIRIDFHPGVAEMDSWRVPDYFAIWPRGHVDPPVSRPALRVCFVRCEHRSRFMDTDAAGPGPYLLNRRTMGRVGAKVSKRGFTRRGLLATLSGGLRGGEICLGEWRTAGPLGCAPG